jgi:protein O-mannosyl-transferase
VTVGLRQAILVVSVAALVNIGALRPGFIHDDIRIIEQNELTAGLGHVPQIFRSGYWSTGDVQVPNLYRPLTILSFALSRAVHDLHPFGFRLFDLALHVLNALLVLLLGRRLSPRPAPPGPALIDPAFAAALLFAVHPVHTEVLGLIVGRAELLATVFSLGSVLVFLRTRTVKEAGPFARAGLPALALLLFVCGFLSKENAVVVPGILLLADLLVVRRRPAWGFHAASLAVLATVLALRVVVLGGLNPAGPIPLIDNPIAQLPFLEGRLTALAVLGRYAWLLVWPRTLSMDYSYRTILPARGLLDPGALAGSLCVAAWVVLLVRTWRRAPGTAFALAFAGIAFAPVANLLFPIGTIMAERLMYLPSVGFCLAAAAVASPLSQEAGVRAAARPGSGGRVTATRALLGLIVAALAVRSVVRLRDWRDEYTLYSATLRVAPENVRALFNYAATCEERGDDAAAIAAYEKALGVWPGFADAHYNLAGVLSRRKSWQEAVDHYTEAVRLQPGRVEYLVNLAHALEALDRHAEARDLLKRAIDLDRRSVVAYTDLGAVELATGNVQEALAAYREAVRLEPSSVDALRNLGVAQREAHDPGAAATLRGALRLRPGDPDILDALGVTLLDTGDSAGAADTLQQGVTARPDHPVYRYHLARALEQSGRLQEAEAQYRQAIRLAPSAPAPLKGLGVLLARLGNRQGALDALERAETLDSRGSVMDQAARTLLADLRREAGGGRRR